MFADPDSVAQLEAARSQVVAAWAQVWAASAQAFLSVAALVVAILLARGDRKHDTDLREKEGTERADAAHKGAKARARSTVLGILPIFTECSSMVKWASRKLAEGKPPNELGRDGPSEADVIRLWRIKAMPDELRRLHPALTDMSSATPAVQTAYFLLLQLQMEFDLFVGEKELGGAEPTWRYSDEETKRIAGLVDGCAAATDVAFKAMTGLFTGLAHER